MAARPDSVVITKKEKLVFDFYQSAAKIKRTETGHDQ